MCTDVLVDLSTGDSVLVADVALLLGSATANCCAHSGGRKFAPMQTTDRVYAALVILAPGSTTVYCQWSHVIRPTANRQGPQAPLTCGVDWCVCDWYSMCTSGNDIVIGQETPDCTATLSPPPQSVQLYCYYCCSSAVHLWPFHSSAHVAASTSGFLERKVKRVHPSIVYVRDITHMRASMYGCDKHAGKWAGIIQCGRLCCREELLQP
jgi:hypothetical protein